ncbi:hypothetical protein B0I33_10777 [Prauserella shujinwangii]|uniref:Uncharacterized protein n=1 Tax=Prauserella shujinwangii TaxID=1453103 RepID=A0A2T0LS55_9PSEU|nr:hypothetical protein [Prauserella shujinwangii]PRX46500.1 hypothetical protein B0I33_10777 [Prauserella shujinwangii]
MRTGQHEYWFPLAVFGFLLLGGAATAATTPEEEFGWFAYAPIDAPRRSVSVLRAVPFSEYERLEAVRLTDSWPGLSLLLAALLATVAWYAWRARRAGTPFPARRLALGTAGAVAATVAGWLVLAVLADTVEHTEVVLVAGPPLLLLAAVLGACAYFGRGRWRRVAGVAGVVVLVVTVLAAVLPVLADQLLIPAAAAALLVLARWERSALLAVIAGLFLAAAVLAPGGPARLLLPAAVLLGWAIGVLLLRGRAARQA